MIQIILRNNNHYLYSYALSIQKIIPNSMIYNDSNNTNNTNNTNNINEKYFINLFIDDILEDTFLKISNNAKLNILLINTKYYKQKYFIRYNYKHTKLQKIKNNINYVFYKFDFLHNSLITLYSNKLIKIPNVISNHNNNNHNNNHNNHNKNISINNKNNIYLHIDEYNYFDNSIIIDAWINHDYFQNIKPKPFLIIYVYSYKLIISNKMQNIKSHSNIIILYNHKYIKLQNYNCSIITANDYNNNFLINQNIFNKKYIIILYSNTCNEILKNNCIYIDFKNIEKCFIEFFNLSFNTRLKHIHNNSINNNNNKYFNKIIDKLKN